MYKGSNGGVAIREEFQCQQASVNTADTMSWSQDQDMQLVTSCSS